MRAEKASNCSQLVMHIKEMKRSHRVILIWNKPLALIIRPK